MTSASRRCRLAAAFLLLLSWWPAAAQPRDPEAALRRLFAAGTVEAGWFSPRFLAQVPEGQVGRVVADLTANFGPLVALRVAGPAGTLQLARASIPVTIALDVEGRIEGLLFGAPSPHGGTAAEIAAGIVAIAEGSTAVLVRVDGRDMVAARADAPMAAGSAFKLLVLQAYEAAVGAGTLARDTVVALEPGDRSLPSGVLQDLAAGTPLTLELLAGLMIRISDNTATDMLLRVLGRGAVEPLSPRNRPLLTTAELFKLAAAAPERAAYAAGTEAERRAILAALAARPLPTASALARAATWREAEWFLTARELCDLLDTLRDSPALNAPPNPLVAAEGLERIGFKGGSEFGVLNLSAAGTMPDGRRACAVVTANGDRPQPEDRIALLFAALFRSLAAPR